MRKSAYPLLTSLVALGASALPSAAWAQDPPAEAAPAPAAPAPAPAPAPEAAPAPAAAPAEPAPAAPAAEAAPAAPAAEAPAAAPAPATTITGYVEGAYHRNLTRASAGGIAPTHVYDTNNGFQLHAAHLAFKHAMNEHVSAVIEFDAGSDAALNNGTAGGGAGGGALLFDVQEAYAVLTDSGFTFTAGKFVTYEGIELIEGPTDPTLTRGLLYAFAEPVTHVGAKLHYATGPVDIGVGVVNGWDTNGPPLYTADNNTKKTFIYRLGITPVPQFFAALSGTYGVEKASDSDPRLSVDLTGAVIPNDMVTINFQANYGAEKNSALSDPTKSATWLGFGLQPVIKVGAASVGARFEYFKDTDGARLGSDDTNYLNFTITPGYTFYDAFTMRAEFRVDNASKEVLTDGKKTQTSLGVGAHYMF